MSWRLFCCRILVLMSLSLCNHVYAQPGLVLGSFSSPDNAEARRAEVQYVLGQPTQVVPAVVQGREVFRVVVAAGQLSYEQLKAQAQAGGLGRGWRYELPNLPAAVPQPIAERSASMISAAPQVKPAEPTRPRVEVVETMPTSMVALGSQGEDVDIEIPEFAKDQFDMRMDGRLDEAVWEQVPGYDNMLVMDPDTLADPRFKTDARFFYTEEGLYVGVYMQQPPETLIARLSSRDLFINRDAVGITLDTSGEGLYGYWFSVNLGGSVMDGKVAAERQFSREWDGPWTSGTVELSDGWSAEMFLPWSMMTMADAENGQRKLGFWINRKVAYLDERWSWPALPFASPRFMSALATMRTPNVQPKQQIAVFPYASYTADAMNNENEPRVGADISWRPSPNLQVTATLNPDFGAVESDDVVVNLTAFETFFPEKRLFFLEGREVFATTPRSRVRTDSPSGSGSRGTSSTFNPEPTTLLNTRRIGGAPKVTVPDDVDVAGVEQGKPTDLIGAVKVTGQNGGLRYGLLSAFEGDMSLPGEFTSGALAGQATEVDTSGRDFGVARVLYEKVGEGRRAIGYLGTLVSHEDGDAIVHGVDAHWLSRNGAWAVDGQVMASDVEDLQGYGAMADIDYKPRQGTQHKLALDYFDENLDVSDLGFIRRNDAMSAVYQYNWSTGRGLTTLRNKRRSLMVSNSWNMEGQVVRSGIFLRNGWTFKNLNEIRTELDYFPVRWEDRNSFGNGAYKMHDRWVAEVAIGTDTSQKLSYSALLGVRQEELSDWTIRSSLGVTYTPSDRFSFELDLNYFQRDGWLLHDQDRLMATYEAGDFQPRLGVDIFFTAKQQLRLSVQWAAIRAQEQDFYLIPEGGGTLDTVADPVAAGIVTSTNGDFALSRLTTQLRYRWEIGPLSDFFLVYTRGSNLPNRIDDEYTDLFQDAISEPIVDTFIAKLRYRFGN